MQFEMYLNIHKYIFIFIVSYSFVDIAFNDRPSPSIAISPSAPQDEMNKYSMYDSRDFSEYFKEFSLGDKK
jgi:hypothetical protein